MSSQVKKQPPHEKFLQAIDALQQRHTFLSLPVAIVKKYGDDECGHLAALMTYYGFLSLFPILIIATAFAQFVARDNPELKSQIISAVTSYFPAVGDTLAASMHSPARTGVAMVFGLLVALYGLRGMTDIVQHALHIIWEVPRKQRAGYPKRIVRGIGVAFAAGFGLIVSAILTGYATSSTYPYFVKVGIGTVGFLVLFTVFWGVYTYGSSARKRRIANIPGALIAATGLLMLQSIGGYLVVHQLGRYTGLNAQFAIVLVIFFWIYLQAQVFLYALEYNTVRAFHLYPRGLDDSRPTQSDKKAYRLYAARDSFLKQP